MNFQVQFINNKKPPVNIGKIICVGRNYLEHVRELDNEIPADPVYFMKPASAISHLNSECEIPGHLGKVSYECELALLINQPLSMAKPEQALDAIGAYGLALDLTLRDLQSELKQKGLPWEKAKSFDNSCQLTDFIWDEKAVHQHHQFKFYIDNSCVQVGDTHKMIRTIPELIADMSHWFKLLPGDIILTGTPSGVGLLNECVTLSFELDRQTICESRVVIR